MQSSLLRRQPRRRGILGGRGKVCNRQRPSAPHGARLGWEPETPLRVCPAISSPELRVHSARFPKVWDRKGWAARHRREPHQGQHFRSAGATTARTTSGLTMALHSGLPKCRAPRARAGARCLPDPGPVSRPAAASRLAVTWSRSHPRPRPGPRRRAPDYLRPPQCSPRCCASHPALRHWLRDTGYATTPLPVTAGPGTHVGAAHTPPGVQDLLTGSWFLPRPAQACARRSRHPRAHHMTPQEEASWASSEERPDLWSGLTWYTLAWPSSKTTSCLIFCPEPKQTIQQIFLLTEIQLARPQEEPPSWVILR